MRKIVGYGFVLVGVLVGAFALAAPLTIGDRIWFSPPAGSNLDWMGSDGQNPFTQGLLIDESPKLWASVYVNGVTSAGDIYGGEILPASTPDLPDLTITGIRFRISVAGSGGSTPIAFRITDGTNECDCGPDYPINCDSPEDNYATLCTATAGTCSFPEGASVTYEMFSIGDCSVGPTILGNVQVEGRY